MGVNDRGTKKWVSLMLPEHVEALKQAFAEMDYKKKPVLDEQQLEENDLMLRQAFQNGLTVKISYFRHNDLHLIEGKISFIDPLEQTLKVEGEIIHLEEVIEVNL